MSETTRAAPTGKTIPGRCGIPTGSPTYLRSRERRGGIPRAGRRSCSGAVKRLAAGAASPQGGAASHGRSDRLVRASRTLRLRGESCAPGSRAIHGCSCRRSVAEVGEKHLARVRRGEPRGKPSEHGTARSGSQPLDGGRAARQSAKADRRLSARRAEGCDEASRERHRERGADSLGLTAEARTDGRCPGPFHRHL